MIGATVEYDALIVLLRERPARDGLAAERAAWLFNLADALTAIGCAPDAEQVRESAMNIVRALSKAVAGGGR